MELDAFADIAWNGKERMKIVKDKKIENKTFLIRNIRILPSKMRGIKVQLFADSKLLLILPLKQEKVNIIILNRYYFI